MSDTELTLKELLDTGISLEDILFNKEPVQVDVTVDTAALAATLQTERNQVLDILNELKSTMIHNNQLNKELLVKALSLVIKSNKNEAATGVTVKEITGLKMVRETSTKLLDTIKILRE